MIEVVEAHSLSSGAQGSQPETMKTLHRSVGELWQSLDITLGGISHICQLTRAPLMVKPIALMKSPTENPNTSVILQRETCVLFGRILRGSEAFEREEVIFRGRLRDCS